MCCAAGTLCTGEVLSCVEHLPQTSAMSPGRYQTSHTNTANCGAVMLTCILNVQQNRMASGAVSANAVQHAVAAVDVWAHAGAQELFKNGRVVKPDD